MHFLNALGHDVEIRIRRKPRLKRRAGIFVTGAALAIPAVAAFRRKTRGERHQPVQRKRYA
ncbi:MAG TPA: hypothetical protein VFP59_12150 [Candidatus Angelobacter sp.]|nr:hypothetical protein [Candidatus Angelobacter sp.]